LQGVPTNRPEEVFDEPATWQESLGWCHRWGAEKCSKFVFKRDAAWGDLPLAPLLLAGHTVVISVHLHARTVSQKEGCLFAGDHL
jgi:hypothetical protein